jgi:citrate lyase subunit beta/citryl-CoA lyase
MRSFLFVPGDSPEKMDKATRSVADALIIDLEDSVAAHQKGIARRSALAFLQEQRNAVARPAIYVRINALSTPLADGDLDIVMTGGPEGIVLPKAAAGADVSLLAARLSLREALHGIDDGVTKIIAIATESAAAIFGLGTYQSASPRLAGLSWGAEDLAADTGASATRIDGSWTEPVRMVRSLALFGAAAAGVPAIDTVYTDFRDLDGLRRECADAIRDGFSAKLAIHPDQVEIINSTFTPSADAIAGAERIVAAFAESGNSGVTSLDGKMLDRPHLTAAMRVLERASRDPSSADAGSVEANPVEPTLP